jgi:hypothetical protein
MNTFPVWWNPELWNSSRETSWRQGNLGYHSATGIVKAIDWYVKNRNPEEVRSQLQSMLTER